MTHEQFLGLISFLWAMEVTQDLKVSTDRTQVMTTLIAEWKRAYQDFKLPDWDKSFPFLGEAPGPDTAAPAGGGAGIPAP